MLRKLKWTWVALAVGALALGFSAGIPSDVKAQSPNADVIVEHPEVFGPGCIGVDVDLVSYFIENCLEHSVMHTDDGVINNVKLHGKLPEGAALPDRAWRRTIQELGFGACGGAANGTYILTPSGEFTYNCRD